MSSLKILYFARLREQCGCAEESIELPPDIITAAELRLHLAGRNGFSALLKDDIRIAIDQHLSNWQSPLREAQEVAFFPPVTGG